MESEQNQDELVNRLLQILPGDVVSKLQQLSPKDYQKVLSRVKGGNVPEFNCESCEKSFKHRSSLLRHRRSHVVQFTCEQCGFTTNRRDNLTRHISSKHGHKRKQDGENSNVTKKAKPAAADETPSGEPEETPTDTEVEAVQRTTANNGSVEKIEIVPATNEEKYDLIHFMKEKKDQVKSLLEEKRIQTNIKYFLVAKIRMIKYSPDGTYEEAVPYFRSATKTLLHTDDNLDHDLNESFQKIFTAMEDFIRNGSGWQLDEVLKLELTITKYKPLGGGSYIDLPPTLKKSLSLVNVINTDDRCLMWAVLSSLHCTEEDPEKVEHYLPFVNSLDVSDINFPAPLSQIGKFERQNRTISINVFGFEDGQIFPLYITKKTYCHHVNLLYLTEGEKGHYVWIKHFHKFLSRTVKYHKSYFFCYLCLQKFNDRNMLHEHERDCKKFQFQKITLPPEGEVLEFKEYAKTARIPFVIYCDFETLTKKIDTCDRNPELSSSNAYQQMEAYSYAYQRVSVDKRYDKPPVIYRGPNVVDHFIQTLLEEEKEIKAILSKIEPMNVNEFVRQEYREAKSCYVCKKPFSEKNHKVIDHDHVTGDIRGIACNNCNLQIKIPNFIPVVFHNLKNFDSALIMNSIGKFKDADIKVIPQNSQKYLSFSLSNLRFIDSLQFLDSSLETLTKNLAKEGQRHFEYLSRSFPDPDTFSLLLRKGVFPYDYVDSREKLEETALPTKKEFFSKLTQKDISDDDYDFAKEVWNKLEIKTLGEYSDVYLQTDVVLLADVFERFRNICLDDYGLDPCHYFTSPGFSWSAMLKKTGVVLDLIHDVDMLLFLEKGVRGGVSSIFHRYAKANNPYLIDSYDPEQKTTYLSYLDANNLYGWAMSQPLPCADFAWVDDVHNLDIQSLCANSKEGYIFEVDLEYPESLHQLHSDFPLAPERKTITVEDLSPYSLDVLTKMQTEEREKKKPNTKQKKKPTLQKCEKLIPNLFDKERYVVHYRNLQLYLDLGMKIKKIHRVLKFQQRCWLKEYIDFNTEKRKNAKNDFEKALFKLLNNSIFGRSLLNTRKHVDIKLCHTEKKTCKYTSKPSYKSCKIFNEDLVAVENKRVNIVIKQPIYIGFCILDLAKLLMYDFHYNHMKRLYDDRIQVCFSDTDSFLYLIETEDVYDDMNEHIHLFDTSDFPEKHFLHSEHNKKVLGKFKDETNGDPISEFVGLRSKMYSFTTDKDEKHTAKGITKSASKKLKHEMYKECLFNLNIVKCEMNVITNTNHVLKTQKVRKKGLVPFDDKRWILNDGITTRAYGHKDNL